MATLTSILSTDIVSSSRGTINTNLQNLNLQGVGNSASIAGQATFATSIVGHTTSIATKLEAASVDQVLASTLSTVAVTPSALGQTRRYIYKSSTQTVVNSVLTADSELLFPVGVNESWGMRALIAWKSGVTPDIKYTFLAPAGMTGYFVDDDANQDSFSPSTITVLAGSTNDKLVGINGIFVNGSVAGNIRLHWAQNVDTPSSVATVYKGSHIMAFRLN